ncbi:unnamed protein product [Rotaria sordida]|uniref:Uncharacterized protein n=1 Tax=Rotaria sordida TaxID=392033 RepID=A0A815EJJ5_9BILA|nr:unnamed protein product [Rotaria sordida]
MPPYFSKTINAYIALTAGAVTATYTESKLTRTQSKVVAIISVNRSEYIFVEHVCYTCGFIVLGSRIIYDSAKILSIL